MFTHAFTATPADIDELGHVNNAVWVRWIQEIAVAHWAHLATPEEQAAFFWVITRHEIDYRGNLRAGETATGETWVAHPPKGARFDRCVDFFDSESGRLLVEVRSTWAMLDRASGRLVRIRPDVAAPFISRD